MEIGVRIPHTGLQASPERVRSWCIAAEQLGFDSLWGADHVVMPRTVDSVYTLPRTPSTIAEDAVSELLSPNFELLTTLAFVAAVTERIKLGTAVAVLPIRNAVLNARQLATIDRYSGGRVLFGVGVGWLEEEAAAMGMPWDRRGPRVAPGKHVEFHGEFHEIPPMDPEPRPAQSSIPILVGGHSRVAIERAARLGDGWIAANMSSDRMAELLRVVDEALDRYGRERSSLPVYCSARPEGTARDDLLRYRELGVHSLQVPFHTLDDLKQFADEVLPSLR
jgi:probable F420-dependent oxidoreductase